MEIKLNKTTEVEELLETSGLDVMEYDTRGKRYRVRLTEGEANNQIEILKIIIETAYKEWN